MRRTPSPRHAFILAAILFLGALPSGAQELVLAKFTDSTKRGLGEAAWQALAISLKQQEVRLVAHADYLKRAAKLRFPGAKATSPAGIAATAKAIPVQGVVTGSATPAKAGAMLLTVVAYDQKGKRKLKKTFRLKQPKFPAKHADELAQQILVSLGMSSPPPPPPVKPEPVAAPATEKPKDDAFLPAWARARETDEPTSAESKPIETARAETRPEAETQAPPRAEPEARRAKGSTHDVLAAAGASLHFRHGMHPRHEALFYPGFRVDARLFLGAFVDDPWLGGLGLGGMFDMAPALEYARSDTQEPWSSRQMQWRIELMYRLAIEGYLAPAFIVKVGFGGLDKPIDSGDDALAKSVAYMAPHAGLEFAMFLWRPYLRFYLSGACLFAVQPGGDVGGSGLGVVATAGFDIQATDYLHIGLGYDLTQFLMEDNSSTGWGAYSDTFQSAFLRIGYIFH
jgi:hypothetical protein